MLSICRVRHKLYSVPVVHLWAFISPECPNRPYPSVYMLSAFTTRQICIHVMLTSTLCPQHRYTYLVIIKDHSLYLISPSQYSYKLIFQTLQM
jgi:hypothetical protein